jgi:7-cyano-7-deazaguanine reductase
LNRLLYHRQSQPKPKALNVLDAGFPEKSPQKIPLERTASHTGDYNSVMSKPRYTRAHAEAGLDAKFPEIETWPNQFPGYEIVVDDPEFTSVCPKTGLPDFGTITIRYMPDKDCLELKSLKEYLQSYRNLGIFQENIVNQVLEDVVRWAKPVWAEVKGDFRPRGGISTVVIARWPRPKADT